MYLTIILYTNMCEYSTIFHIFSGEYLYYCSISLIFSGHSFIVLQQSRKVDTKNTIFVFNFQKRTRSGNMPFHGLSKRISVLRSEHDLQKYFCVPIRLCCILYGNFPARDRPKKYALAFSLFCVLHGIYNPDRNTGKRAN